MGKFVNHSTQSISMYEVVDMLERDRIRKNYPNRYKNIVFRSQLERTWARFFDLLGWRFQYEPIDLIDYIPDFWIKGDRKDILVEIKPHSRFSQFVDDGAVAKFLKSEGLHRFEGVKGKQFALPSLTRLLNYHNGSLKDDDHEESIYTKWFDDQGNWVPVKESEMWKDGTSGYDQIECERAPEMLLLGIMVEPYELDRWTGNGTRIGWFIDGEPALLTKKFDRWGITSAKGSRKDRITDELPTDLQADLRLAPFAESLELFNEAGNLSQWNPPVEFKPNPIFRPGAIP